jgi:tRNA-dihydrouridine synthase
MRMGIDDSIQFTDARAQKLLAHVGAGIDQNAGCPRIREPFN